MHEKRRGVYLLTWVIVLTFCSCEGGKEFKYHDHPFLAQSPWPIVHRTPAQMASSPFPGPSTETGKLTVEKSSIGGPAWVLFGSDGRMFYGAVNYFTFTHDFAVVDRESLEIVGDKYAIPVSSVLGGIYGFIDFENCVWAATDLTIHRLCEENGLFYERLKVDLQSIGNFHPGEAILALMPLYHSPAFMDIAFVTTGIVYERQNETLIARVVGAKAGVVRIFSGERNAEVMYLTFPGEGVSNSIAVDHRDGIYVITHRKLYKLVLDSTYPAGITISWSYAYDPGPDVAGSYPCPSTTDIRMCTILSYLGNVKFFNGSGTTPTLIGDDEEFIAFGDGALPMRLIVLRTEDGSEVEIDDPVPFSHDPSSLTENTITAWGYWFALENNNTESSGVAGYEIVKQGSSVRVVKRWLNTGILAPNAVPLISGASMELYVYELQGEHLSGSWYITALDLKTGKVRWRAHIGDGFAYNSTYAPLTLDDRGNIYIGFVTGILKLYAR